MQGNLPRTRGPVYSTFGDDPEMGPLVELFVEGLCDRAEAFVDRLQASDHTELRRLAHQMAGAAGSYGFNELTADAATLEAALREERPEAEIAAAVNSLIDMCRRARVGTAESPTGRCAD